jgi:hypothetical protein
VVDSRQDEIGTAVKHGVHSELHAVDRGAVDRVYRSTVVIFVAIYLKHLVDRNSRRLPRMRSIGSNGYNIAHRLYIINEQMKTGCKNAVVVGNQYERAVG